MVPTHEDLDRNESTSSKIDLRLVVQEELAVVDRGAKRDFQVEALIRFGAHLVIEHDDLIAPARLGGVQGRIGAREQFVCSHTRGVRYRNTETRSAIDGLSADVDWQC